MRNAAIGVALVLLLSGCHQEVRFKPGMEMKRKVV
jgi:hypothetical protein